MSGSLEAIKLDKFWYQDLFLSDYSFYLKYVMAFGSSDKSKCNG